MSHALLSCTFCRRPLPVSYVQTERLEPCPHCNTRQQILAFPAALKSAAPANYGKPLLSEEDASCFYHADKQAEVPCSSCGRFLCGLCNVPFRGQHLCPSCLEAGLHTGQFGETRASYPAYDGVALVLAILGNVLIFLLPILAPLALYYGVRAWRTKGLPVASGRGRATVAIFIAGAQICLMLLMVIGLLTAGSEDF